MPKFQCQMSNVQFPMPNVQCPVSNAKFQCPIFNAKCPMSNFQCQMSIGRSNCPAGHQKFFENETKNFRLNISKNVFSNCPVHVGQWRILPCPFRGGRWETWFMDDPLPEVAREAKDSPVE